MTTIESGNTGTKTEMSGQSSSRLLRQEDAARYLSVSPRALEAWRHRGGGPPAVFISKRCVRYRLSDLEDWIQAHVRASTSDRGGAAA